VRVLVVEDEEHLAEGLRKGLDAEGFATDVAANGTDGLWMAREHPYDAIVLDIMLPGINGYRVCATLREEGQQAPAPVSARLVPLATTSPAADRFAGRGRGRSHSDTEASLVSL